MRFACGQPGGRKERFIREVCAWHSRPLWWWCQDAPLCGTPHNGASRYHRRIAGLGFSGGKTQTQQLDATTDGRRSTQIAAFAILGRPASAKPLPHSCLGKLMVRLVSVLSALSLQPCLLPIPPLPEEDAVVKLILPQNMPQKPNDFRGRRP